MRSWLTKKSGVEGKFTKFSGEPRDARKNRGMQPIFEQILSKIDFKMQNWALPKFQILVYEIKIRILKSISKIQNQTPRIRSPYSSRISFRDLKIWILRPRFGLNLKFQLKLNFFFYKILIFIRYTWLDLRRGASRRATRRRRSGRQLKKIKTIDLMIKHDFSYRFACFEVFFGNLITALCVLV